jgi:hypothetical protein
VRITLLVGRSECRLTGDEASWLERSIREACVNERGQTFSLDETVWACILLANAVREEIGIDSGPEPIQLSESQIVCLLTLVLDAENAKHRAGIDALYAALRRHRGLPVD